MNIRHKLRLVFTGLSALCFSLLPVFSQLSGPKTVFWEISGNGLEKPSYLFGTIHLMPKNEFETFRIVDEKLKKSQQMVLEMIIDVPLKQQIEWAKQMMLPEGHTLRDYMPEEDYNRLKQFVLDSLGVKEMMFNAYIKFKPFAFYSALIPSVVGKRIVGYEIYFSKIARKKDIQVQGLESFEFQTGIFDSIPNDKQMDMFFSNAGDMKKEFSDILETYKKQDIYHMSEVTSDETAPGNFEERLISMRNDAWIPKLEAFMKDKPSFIAVGAGHLAGEHGLILKLREEGYDVEPIMLREKNR